MARVVGEYGLQHKQDELVAVMEFNLDELYDLLSRYDNDGFRHDIQSAIGKIEAKMHRIEGDYDTKVAAKCACGADGYFCMGCNKLYCTKLNPPREGRCTVCFVHSRMALRMNHD